MIYGPKGRFGPPPFRLGSGEQSSCDLARQLITCVPQGTPIDQFDALATGVREDAPWLPQRGRTAPVTPTRKGERVRVYVIHPDDETGFAGGTLRKLTDAGHPVDIGILSHGEGGRLLERDAEGGVVERRDLPAFHVVCVRDAEAQAAAQTLNASMDYLFAPNAGLDFGFTHSTAQTLRTWNDELPGGVSEILRRLVGDLRARKPDLVMTSDPEDDPMGSGHGHHAALGVLVDLAVRLAADTSVGEGAPHAVGSIATFAPARGPWDVEVQVNPEDRLSGARAYPSQFTPEVLAQDPFWSRPTERFRERLSTPGPEGTARKSPLGRLR